MLGVAADDGHHVDATLLQPLIAFSAACGAFPCPEAGLVSTVTRPISCLITG